MKKDVCVDFGRGREVQFGVPAEPAMAADQARRWLDDQFVARECEPLRPTGKVLTVDKVLVLAEAIGAQALQDDEALREAFGRAVVAALGQPATVRIDVEGRAVSF